MTAPAPTDIDPTERYLPPVTLLVTISLAIAVADGIIMAAFIPAAAPSFLTLVLATAGAVALLAALVVLSRIRPFAWHAFFTVAKWALLAYVVEAGMIEYVLVHNHVGGVQLLVMTMLLVLFALDVPCIISFTVARYQDVGQPNQ